MRILDFNNNELTLNSVDYYKGHLQEERIFIAHHDAVEAVEEQGHWETVAEYPNGGKDVEWVVDVPGVEASEAWDEYENILRYVEYTAEELAEREAEQQEREHRQQRQNSLIDDGVLWAELAAAITEGVNSV